MDNIPQQLESKNSKKILRKLFYFEPATFSSITLQCRISLKNIRTLDANYFILHCNMRGLHRWYLIEPHFYVGPCSSNGASETWLVRILWKACLEFRKAFNNLFCQDAILKIFQVNKFWHGVIPLGDYGGHGDHQHHPDHQVLDQEAFGKPCSWEPQSWPCSCSICKQEEKGKESYQCEK